jgi:hypothetical protein
MGPRDDGDTIEFSHVMSLSVTTERPSDSAQCAFSSGLFQRADSHSGAGRLAPKKMADGNRSRHGAEVLTCLAD